MTRVPPRAVAPKASSSTKWTTAAVSGGGGGGGGVVRGTAGAEIQASFCRGHNDKFRHIFAENRTQW